MMMVSRTKRFLLISVVSLAVSALNVPSFGADIDVKGTGAEKSPQKVDPQADKQRLIESRKEQQQKRGELRDAVKSGASKDEINKLKTQVKEGQKAIVQDKKEIREQKLGSSKDQADTKQSPQSSK
jgi:hypothetical protein